MTLLLRWLFIPIIVLIVLLFWKGSPLLIKSALLIVPAVGIISWFAYEGAFSGGGGLEKIYGLLTLIGFLMVYEIGMLVDRYYLVKKSISTVEDDVLLITGVVLLIASVIYFVIAISE
ncbi:hypothetical protein IRZ83_16395 [Flavobacterium sp. JLP]|uniref:hypothetical protein n=1 Tax=unclassified Flavobacterium TaxID=196869 RepID=UPI00188BA401|nr:MULTISPECIES: hypothetical protein [unclassified Flavobacterium]MBF4493742.1 hypothetical protein [Flavobacterium sp. MR2016-29]MBF4508258.1 hypothetical protein [Flavobacterium sp. JLP]